MLSVGALPPLYLLPLLVVAFTSLLWLAFGAKTPRAAFLIGWSFGFGHYAAGLYWITNALLVDAAKFGWLVPFAVSGLSLFLGLFSAATLYVLHRARARGLHPTHACWNEPLERTENTSKSLRAISVARLSRISSASIVPLTRRRSSL